MKDYTLFHGGSRIGSNWLGEEFWMVHMPRLLNLNPKLSPLFLFHPPPNPPYLPAAALSQATPKYSTHSRPAPLFLLSTTRPRGVCSWDKKSMGRLRSRVEKAAGGVELLRDAASHAGYSGAACHCPPPQTGGCCCCLILTSHHTLSHFLVVLQWGGFCTKKHSIEKVIMKIP